MIDRAEKERRQQCMRRWYFNMKPRQRSVLCRQLQRTYGLKRHIVYDMLEGRTYISDERLSIINLIANRDRFIFTDYFRNDE